MKLCIFKEFPSSAPVGLDQEHNAFQLSLKEEIWSVRTKIKCKYRFHRTKVKTAAVKHRC